MDLIITLIILFIIFIINIFIDINNKLLEALINLIPLVYPTYKLWRSDLRKNIKWMSLLNKDVYFIFSALYKNCDIDREKFLQLVNYIKSYDSDTLSRNISYTLNDDNLYNYKFKIYNVDDIEISFDNLTKELYIEYSGGRSYKFSLNKIKAIANKLNSILSDIHYRGVISEIEINFSSENNEIVTNPFIKKFFNKFKNSNVNIQYECKNGSVIKIDNKKIELKNSSIMSLIDDINDELKVNNFKDIF